MIDLKMIQEQGLVFAKRRGLAQSPFHSLTHLQDEVEEAVVEFERRKISALGEELADVILTVSTIAEQLGLDIEEEIRKKHMKNLGRIP